MEQFEQIWKSLSPFKKIEKWNTILEPSFKKLAGFYLSMNMNKYTKLNMDLYNFANQNNGDAM